MSRKRRRHVHVFVSKADGDAPRTIRRAADGAKRRDTGRATTRTPRTIARWAVVIVLVAWAAARGVSPFTNIGFAVTLAPLVLGSTRADALGRRGSYDTTARAIVFRMVASLVAVIGAVVVAIRPPALTIVVATAVLLDVSLARREGLPAGLVRTGRKISDNVRNFFKAQPRVRLRIP